MSQTPNISHIIPMSTRAVEEISKGAASEIAMQVESDEDLNQYFELSEFNPMNVAQRSRTLKEIQSKESSKTEDAEEAAEVGEQILDTEAIDSTAERYNKSNFELNAKTLKILRGQLAKGNTSDEILQKVSGVYSDAALADEAMDFLAETSDGQLLAATQEAKEKLNKDRGKEIRAGRNMGAQAREFAQEGLGSPSSLRDLYRDIILNPRDPLKLFDELTDKFRYPKLKTALNFMLHALGADLKSKGPSIQRGELKRLFDETRSMQGILGVFRFFQSRMKLIQMGFNSHGLMFPSRLDFEMLSRILVKILQERFMNPEKLLQLAKVLGIAEEPAAQIIVFSQMFEALKQIAPRYFRDPRHREELKKVLVDTLEKLEDQLEEEEEEK